MKYKISIIIPFKNAKKFIKNNVDNTLKISKNFNNIEVIYIDDNSNDGSYKILSNIISKHKNFKLLKNKKKNESGPGIARNIGILHSEAKYLIFLDIDDKLVLKNFRKLFIFIKKKTFNFIYLKKITKVKSSPYRKYNRKKLKIFFTKSNNMEVISILFRKNFLLKNKIFFLKDIYEDIFFLFKCHFLNKIKIYLFKKNIYLKRNNPKSITNSKPTFLHIKSKFNAWKSIALFIRKNIQPRTYEKLKPYLQYRFRGELADEYEKIANSKIHRIRKKILMNYIVKYYKELINRKFIPITIKDFKVKEIINS